MNSVDEKRDTAQIELLRGVQDLLQSMLIVQLGQAGLTQHEIREVVGIDIHRVNRILKYFKKGRK